jgi:hypothetical protein
LQFGREWGKEGFEIYISDERYSFSMNQEYDSSTIYKELYLNFFLHFSKDFAKYTSKVK